MRLVATSCRPVVGGDDDVDLIEQRRHLLNGQGARAIGLDVLDRGIEARNAKEIGPVFRALRGEQAIAA